MTHTQKVVELFKKNKPTSEWFNNVKEDRIMSTGNCDICGHWDSGLFDGACTECMNRYSGNFIQARMELKELIKNPETKIGKLKKIANLARISMVCTFNE